MNNGNITFIRHFALKLQNRGNYAKENVVPCTSYILCELVLRFSIIRFKYFYLNLLYTSEFKYKPVHQNQLKLSPLIHNGGKHVMEVLLWRYMI